LSGNAIICETMRLNWRHMSRGMGGRLRYPGMSLSAWQEHERILGSMIGGDAEAAAMLMSTHLVEAHQRAATTHRIASEASQ
jgi:DNA-binding GntR family transcriptional regulator